VIEQRNNLVATYLRFSHDEPSESNSIATQRTMLTQYCNENGLTIAEEYCDDGHSGFSFDRPNFQRMIDDIYADKINFVLTKDLSRLGRNYYQAGFYMDEVFARQNVRFIALKDNVDTLNNDVHSDIIVPFKNIMNDLYVRDTSRKVKAALDARAKAGQYLVSIPPYGYTKSPEDKHKLIIDEEAAEIVREIFSMVIDGKSVYRITKVLSGKYPTPSQYLESKYPSLFQSKSKYSLWKSTAVRYMLNNPVYLGKSTHGKTRKKTINAKTASKRPVDEWIVVDDTHEPIVTAETWDKAQEMLKVRRRTPAHSDSPHIFAGLLRCLDCGYVMGLHQRQAIAYFSCGKYCAYGKDYCASHYIDEKKLYKTVLDSIRELAQVACKDEAELIKILEKESNIAEVGSTRKSANENKRIEMRIAQLDLIIKKLYEDSVLGLLPQERLYSMMSDYENEQRELKERLNVLNRQKQEQGANKSKTDGFIAAVKEQANIQELDAVVLNQLISKVEIGQAEVNPETGQKEQRIYITYKFSQEAQSLEVEGLRKLKRRCPA